MFDSTDYFYSQERVAGNFVVDSETGATIRPKFGGGLFQWRVLFYSRNGANIWPT